MAEIKGFLLIKKTYAVLCRNCGFRGQANLGKHPIESLEAGAEEYCPVCGCLSLVGDRGDGNEK